MGHVKVLKCHQETSFQTAFQIEVASEIRAPNSSMVIPFIHKKLSMKVPCNLSTFFFHKKFRMWQKPDHKKTAHRPCYCSGSQLISLTKRLLSLRSGRCESFVFFLMRQLTCIKNQEQSTFWQRSQTFARIVSVHLVARYQWGHRWTFSQKTEQLILNNLCLCCCQMEALRVPQ